MAIYQSTNPAPAVAVFVYRVVSNLEGLFTSLMNWQTRRSTHRELSRLSDEQLDDIGLARGDIPSLVSKVTYH